MNKLTIIGLLVLTLLFGACKTENYAKKRKAEQKKFNDYVAARGLELSNDSAYCFSLPAPWPENLYFKTHRGTYIRLIEREGEKRVAENGNTIVLRYRAYNLDGGDYGNNIYNREGFIYVYSPDGYSPSIAFIDAASCIRHEDKFEMLVDSKVGTQEQTEDVVTIRIFIDDTTITN
jgi:hypothetical protein